MDAERLPLSNRIWRDIFIFESLNSTNDCLKELAQSGAPAGTVVIAKEQKTGKGRLGRSWESPRGGAWFSLLLRPPIPLEQAGCISVLIAVSLARALREHWGVPVGVKWPNDLYVPHPHPPAPSPLCSPLPQRGEGMGRSVLMQHLSPSVVASKRFGVRYQKLGGILIELSTNTAQIEWLVAGVGININNQLPADIPATSLARELGYHVALEDFFERALAALAHDYEQFLSEGFAFVHAHWQRLSVLPPRILVKTNSGEITAEVLGLAPSGRLIVRTDAGLRELNSEEVTLCPL